MIRLRKLQESDLKKLDELWKQYWASSGSFPGLTNRIIDAVAENDEGRIIGYGQARLFAEAMLFLDPTTRKRERALATQGLMLECFRGIDKANIEEVYAFIRDPEFVQFISKRYGFKVIDNPGQLLLRRL